MTLAIGALANDGGDSGGGENVGYLTAVSLWNNSISSGEDLIFSARMISQCRQNKILMTPTIFHHWRKAGKLSRKLLDTGMVPNAAPTRQ